MKQPTDAFSCYSYHTLVTQVELLAANAPSAGAGIERSRPNQQVSPDEA
ncbi:MAG: hypothetical protein MI757_20200 [Pirellulales bacterium]|nr:hypothetical protein [Pirellulales bacterium]